MPAPSQSLSAVVVSGGKQYRVALGDRILVDRVAAEPGTELTLDRVLMVADGDDFKVGAPGVDGLTVTARVIGDAKGKKIDVLRYKSKKRVRVHRGARAALTALEIVTIGDRQLERPAKAEKTKAEKTKAEKSAKQPRAERASAATGAEATVAADTAPETKPRRTRATEAPVPEATSEEAVKPARRSRAKKSETEEQTTDGA